MLGLFHKKQEQTVLSPMSGYAKKIDAVADEAFAEKMLGDGAAVVPDKGEIYSPVNGVLADITDTKHAFCITAKDGTDILLHVGINTVNLKGEGFTVFKKAGDSVRAGEKLAEVDLELLKKHGMPFDTPVLLTEPEHFEIVRISDGRLRGGTDVLFTYKKR